MKCELYHDSFQNWRSYPIQKAQLIIPVKLLKKLIGIYTDIGDVVIDPCAGSGSTLRAAAEMRRNAYGFEIDRNFYKAAKEQMLNSLQIDQMNLLDFEPRANGNRQIAMW